MKIKPIKTGKDHEAALRRIEELWGAPEGSAGGDELDILLSLVESYEREHFPVDVPDPIEAIKFRLDQQGSSYRSLEGVIGRRERVYEVMRRDRPLSLAMIRKLHRELRIPAEVLLKPVRLRKRTTQAQRSALLKKRS